MEQLIRISYLNLMFASCILIVIIRWKNIYTYGYKIGADGFFYSVFTTEWFLFIERDNFVCFWIEIRK